MKTIIVYKSKYGSSRQYASWLAQELGCEVKEPDTVTLNRLSEYDTIIYIGGLYAGSVNGFKKISKQLEALKGKQLLLCMVGMTNPTETEKYRHMFENNVSEKYREAIKPFALRGDQLFSKMSGMHRLMMKMPKVMTEKIPEAQRTEEDKRFIESFGKDMCFAKRENLRDIIEYIASFNKN